MNQTIKKKWVDALRSGNYEQGSYMLKSGDGRYCCLGVLCDLAVQEGVAREERTTNTPDPQYYYDGAADLLPASVIKWAGLDSNNAQVEYGDGVVPLSVLNDEENLTFNEIADLVEEQL